MVEDAVRECQEAGITVRMLTGDNLLTAKTIASRCGILTEKGIALEGPFFRRLPKSEVDRIIPNLQVSMFI
jgi:Ca2+-transporting ATPase